MTDTLWEWYEPHTDYVQAIRLTDDNFDAVAEELSRQGYFVSKNIHYNQRVSITVQSSPECHLNEPLTCKVIQQYFVIRRGQPLTVMDYNELRKEWRKTDDPYRR